MPLATFILKLKNQPKEIDFTETMSLIDSLYDFTPTSFKNGNLTNKTGENNGSCKLFAFAQLHQLSEEDTLACFGQYYQKEVLENPDEKNHQNIRNFMQTGWSGISFDAFPLQKK